MDIEAARREVQAILDSGIFSPSSRQAKLLEYLFDKVVHGRADDLKEYTIAVELFQKAADFDQHSDATVRVEAHRLRKKLQKYYETSGRDHNCRVLLPPGQYVLCFEASGRDAPAAPVAEQAAADRSGGRKRPMLAAALALWAVVASAVAIGFVLLYYSRPGSRSTDAAAASAENAASVTIADPEPDAVRILAGRTGDTYVDVAGRRWRRDQFYDGGVARNVDHQVTSRTGRPQLFRTAREGAFSYRIPLPPGEYELRMYFTDPDGWGVERDPERRFKIMRVKANGEEILKGYHLAVEASYRADVRAFAHLRPNEKGVLHLQFYSDRGPAAVSAIELSPMARGRVRPVRIVAQPQAFRDKQGRLWSPDDYYAGGALGGYPSMIAGDLDPGIFSSERIGDFEYFIPVPPGEYQVTLYFGEGWYGREGSGGGGEGTRVFNVLLKNQMMLKDFDMLREGPPQRLITRTFRRVRPDRSGKLHLTFEAQQNFASIRAIEVLPEN